MKISTLTQEKKSKTLIHPLIKKTPFHTKIPRNIYAQYIQDKMQFLRNRILEGRRKKQKPMSLDSFTKEEALQRKRLHIFCLFQTTSVHFNYNH